MEKLVAYEEGNKDPSRPLLLRMSKLYHRPLLLFYLDRQPKIGDRGEDFRTLPRDFEETDDATVDVLIRDIKARQSLVRDTLIDEDEEIHLGFVGSLRVEHGIARIVDTIRKAIKFNLEYYRSQQNRYKKHHSSAIH